MVARRTVVTTAAWAVPAVIVGAPAAAMTCSYVDASNVGIIPGASGKDVEWIGDQIYPVTGTSAQPAVQTWILGAVDTPNLELGDSNFAGAVAAPCPVTGTFGAKVTIEVATYRNLKTPIGTDVQPMALDLMTERTWRYAGALEDHGFVQQSDVSNPVKGNPVVPPGGKLNALQLGAGPGIVLKSTSADGPMETGELPRSSKTQDGALIAAGPHGYPGYTWDITLQATNGVSPTFYTILRNAMFGNSGRTRRWVTFKYIITIELSNGNKLTYTTTDI